MRLHPSYAQATLKQAPPSKTREAERRQTHPTGDRIEPMRRALVLFSSPACAEEDRGSALAFRRSTAAFEAVTPRPDPGPRFLEPPGANGRTLPGTSAASTSRSGHVPDGTMPRAARRRGYEPRLREPHSLRQSA